MNRVSRNSVEALAFISVEPLSVLMNSTHPSISNTAVPKEPAVCSAQPRGCLRPVVKAVQPTDAPGGAVGYKVVSGYRRKTRHAASNPSLASIASCPPYLADTIFQVPG